MASSLVGIVGSGSACVVFGTQSGSLESTDGVSCANGPLVGGNVMMALSPNVGGNVGDNVMMAPSPAGVDPLFFQAAISSRILLPSARSICNSGFSAAPAAALASSNKAALTCEMRRRCQP
jgi:hypothetical protein